jgi:hypothetical protein
MSHSICLGIFLGDVDNDGLQNYAMMTLGMKNNKKDESTQ